MKTIYLLTPLNEGVADWIDENVHTEPWQWLGKSLGVEHRFVEDIYNALSGGGFTLDEDFLMQ